MSKPNYRQIYAKKAARENRIKSICPSIPNTSGIYAFHRLDEAGIKRAYVGQAVNLLERCASHLGEYDHIALSLKKHGFYSRENSYGWNLSYKTCPKSELDEKEIATIKAFADKGFQMYNVTAGGQGLGKVVSGQYKQPKTYTQGIQQGKKVLARELSSIAEKHLIIRLKPEKEHNKVSQKQYEKFMSLINGGEDDGN
nr:MAG TPA: intron-associated endonuclease 1 [Bacteriophage sp.]